MDSISNIFAALSNKNRLRIVAVLFYYNELCVCYLKDFLGVSGATVSRHLSILQHTKIISGRKQGKWIYYSLTENFKKEVELVTWLNEKIKHNEKYLKDLDLLKELLEKNQFVKRRF